MKFTASLGLRASLVALVALVATACDTSDSDLDPRPPCQGTGCVNVTGGAGGSGGGGQGGSGGGSVTNDVVGNVGVLNENTFNVISPYAGAATIFTTSTAGDVIDAPYGDAVTSFTLPSVMSGPTWFFVRDETVGATGVLSTHSVVNVPVSGGVTLPMVDRNVLSAITTMLPVPTTLDTSRAHLILAISRNGQPLSGVSLTTPFPGATIAYDNGPGLYTNQANQTGTAGMILVLDIDGPQATELRDLTIVDAQQQGFTIQVRIQATAATIAGFQI